MKADSASIVAAAAGAVAFVVLALLVVVGTAIIPFARLSEAVALVFVGMAVLAIGLGCWVAVTFARRWWDDEPR